MAESLLHSIFHWAQRENPEGVQQQPTGSHLPSFSIEKKHAVKKRDGSK